jgi:hypothetical protein
MYKFLLDAKCDCQFPRVIASFRVISFWDLNSRWVQSWAKQTEVVFKTKYYSLHTNYAYSNLQPSY